MDDPPELKVLIADDEPLAAERLQLLLARCPGIDLVGTASDGESAVRMAQALQPDTLLLDIMQRRGETVRDIFRQLFERNPVQRIFRFLDEETTWTENLQIMNSVRPWPFLRSIAQVLRGRPGRR